LRREAAARLPADRFCRAHRCSAAEYQEDLVQFTYSLSISRFATALAIAVLLGAGLMPLESSAQRAGAAGEEESQANQPTRRTPAMRERVYQRLSEAQECAEAGDTTCAREKLGEVQAMDDLNSYERAQMWNFFAFIAFENDDYGEAIRAYENVLQQEELPLGLEQTTMYSLATLYVQEERYDEGLDMLQRWFTTQTMPSADSYILLAQIYYQLGRYADGIDPVLQALEVAEAQGRDPQEGWYQLLNVFYFELENYPKVIETLTTLLENWTKRDYLIQLAGVFGQEGEDRATLALFEAAYEAGWLESSSDFTNLAQMLMSADIPVKAADILQPRLEDGTVESTEANWRLLAQAWQLAQDDRKAIPALERASSLADDGNLDMLLAQSHANLAQWGDCVEAARSALRRGGLNREDQTNIILGSCLSEQGEYVEARNAFQAAARDERSRRAANQWIDYVNSEMAREQANREALARLNR
jgi:tetratricopeptide (TPR) repeat protein